MRRTAIALLLGKGDPLPPLARAQQLLPNAYVYLLHPDFAHLERTHADILAQAAHKGDQQYPLLSQLCYFEDLRRQQHCQLVISLLDQSPSLLSATP
jgi:hypothetical protein